MLDDLKNITKNSDNELLRYFNNINIPNEIILIEEVT